MVVLDSWALLAYLRGEPVAKLVGTEWASEGAAMCSVNLGEALYLETRRVGAARSEDVIRKVRSNLTIVDPDWDLVSAAAGVKAGGGLSYADAFCVATAQRLAAPLWTGDPEIVALSGEVDVVDLCS